MENPYKHAADPLPATPEDQKISDYEIAIGPNSAYYLPKFEALESGGSAIGWHWPAFFVTSWWFLYRKMWLPGLLNLFYPVILLIVLGIASAIGLAFVKTHPILSALIALALLAVPSFLLSMYANALYFRHIRNLIDRLPRALAQVPDKRIARLERDGGTGVGAMVGTMVCVGFFGLFFVGGILAAIAIPAYQDYTIRAQVAEGLNLAGPIKAGVTEFQLQNNRWPDQADFDAERPSGKYVNSVGVAAGSIVITYGHEANPYIASQRLILVPGIAADGSVSWRCGYAAGVSGVEYGDGPSGSDIPEKYLPKACRP